LGGTSLSAAKGVAKGVASDQTTPIPLVWACHPIRFISLVLGHWDFPPVPFMLQRDFSMTIKKD
jgi:hypothetical protein